MHSIDKGWTLFLDRDGVINRHIEDGYVCRWEDFEFIPSFLASAGRLAQIFGKVVVVTNQSCIAKGLATKAAIASIHRKMLKGIEEAGGRVDGIYLCPHDTADACECRKPNTGLAILAKGEFPEIELKRSVMVGDKPIDIAFGKSLGMLTVLISRNKDAAESSGADYVCANIPEFCSKIPRPPKTDEFLPAIRVSRRI